jgi:hypothetical protein
VIVIHVLYQKAKIWRIVSISITDLCHNDWWRIRTGNSAFARTLCIGAYLESASKYVA